MSSIWGDWLERWFAILGHRAPSSGSLNLNDLAGSGGRMDVLVRAVNAALFVSHGVRRDSHVVLHLMGGEGPERRIWFDGSLLGGVRPDERSIAGQIKGVMKRAVPPRGHFEEFSSGIMHSGGDLAQTLGEWGERGVFAVALDVRGGSFATLPESKSLGFVLSDDWPLSDQELSQLRDTASLSLGNMWLQGHSCIAILHHLMDSI